MVSWCRKGVRKVALFLCSLMALPFILLLTDAHDSEESGCLSDGEGLKPSAKRVGEFTEKKVKEVLLSS